MRRWVCLVALLAGFASNGYVWSARPRLPVPIERGLESLRTGTPSLPTTDWWVRA